MPCLNKIEPHWVAKAGKSLFYKLYTNVTYDILNVIGIE